MFNNFTLSKESMNVIYVPVGSMPRRKTIEYLTNTLENFDGYEVQLIAVTSEYKFDCSVDTYGNISYTPCE